jgi:hypothetical protein
LMIVPQDIGGIFPTRASNLEWKNNSILYGFT